MLVHEVQHSKLAVLGGVVRLDHESAEAVFRVGWRSDPRPLGAVVQGTYAHLALADLWGRLADRAASPAAERAAARRAPRTTGPRSTTLFSSFWALVNSPGRAQSSWRACAAATSGSAPRAGRPSVRAAEHAERGDPADDAENAADRLTNGHFG